MSWLDLVTKILPSFTFLSAVRRLKATIHKHYSTSVHPHKKATEDDRPQPSTMTSPRRWIVRTAELGFVLWGILVVTLHLHATSVAILHNFDGCLLEMRPWLFAEYNCIVLELHCERLGHHVDLDNVLVPLAASGVRELIFSSCPHLRMRSQLQTLSNLLVLKVYNSTSVEWSTDAALVHSVHKCIQFVYLVDTNLSRIRDGLSSPEFPPSLFDIEIAGTNLSILPTNLYKDWGNDRFLDFFVFENVYDAWPKYPMPSTRCVSDTSPFAPMA